MHHFLQERCLHAPGTELIHPERSFVLQRGSPRVKGEVHIIVQQAANRRHVDIREADESSGEIGRIVEGSEDASKLGVKQVFCKRPEKERKNLVLYKD